jgi:hypothetical protein
MGCSRVGRDAVKDWLQCLAPGNRICHSHTHSADVLGDDGSLLSELNFYGVPLVHLSYIYWQRIQLLSPLLQPGSDCAASEGLGLGWSGMFAARQMFLEPCFLFCCWAICFYSLSFLQGGFERLPLLNGCFRFASIKPHIMKTRVRSSFS